MASYRPKSLDELNNMYDKTLSAEQAIKKGTSKLETESGVKVEPVPEINIPTDVPVVPDIIKDSATDKEIEDLSFAVDDFIRHFSGEPAKPAPTSYGKPIIRQQSQHKPNAQVIQKELQASTIPEEGDLSGLMNEYIKIMNDEEEEPKLGKMFSRLKKKDRKKSHNIIEESEADKAEDLPEIQTEQIPLNESQPEAESQDESFYTTETYDTSDAPTFEQNENQYGLTSDEVPDNANQEQNLYTTLERNEEAGKNKKTSTRSSAGRITARVILSILFAISLAATVAVASMNLVLNINTGKTALGDYYFFTTRYSSEDAGVESGDLIICKSSTYLSDGDKAVYIYTNEFTSQKEFSFGVKNGGTTDDYGKTLYNIGAQQIAREDALGTIEKTVPKAGKIVDIIFANYLLFVIFLAAITIVLFVLITLVLRNKEKDAGKSKSKKKLAMKTKKLKEPSEEEVVEANDNSADTQSGGMEASGDFDNVGLYDNLFNDID